MHELSICQSLLQQIESIAEQHNASRVYHVKLQIGPLSGVEAQLLKNAFPIAVAGSIAEQADLEIEQLPIRVACKHCGAETEASLNRLICGSCGHWQTRLLSGDEILLASLELAPSLGESSSGVHVN